MPEIHGSSMKAWITSCPVDVAQVGDDWMATKPGHGPSPIRLAYYRVRHWRRFRGGWEPLYLNGRLVTWMKETGPMSFSGTWVH